MTDLERLAGVTVHGVQRRDPGGPLVLCLDPETGTTFAVQPGETIGAALGRVKARYSAVRGEICGTQGVSR
jgi:hypothetical protein